MDIMKEFKSDLVVKEDENRRRYSIVDINEGRDKGKKFKLSEMNVVDSMRFLTRFTNALSDTGLMPDYIARAVEVEWQTLFGVTFASLAAIKEEVFIGLVLSLYEKSIQIWGGGEWRDVIPEVDLMDMKNFLGLPDKVIELHAGFSLAAAVSGFWMVAGAEAEEVKKSLKDKMTDQKASNLQEPSTLTTQSAQS